MTLSKNNKGVVTETESVNFIFEAFEKINSFISSGDVVTELTIDKANTNSLYLSFDMKGFSFEIRISNHTKRLKQHEEMEIVTVAKGVVDTYFMYINDKKSFDIILNSLKSF